MPEVATVTCPACGAAAAGGRYCSQCAAPLAGGAPSAARSRPAPPAGVYRRPAHRRPTISGWLKVLIVALVAAAVVAVTVAIVLAVGIGKASNSFNAAVTAKPGRPATYRGPSYPGMLTQDQVAGGAGSQIDTTDEGLTAGNLARSASFLGPVLCTPVRITNHSRAIKDLGPHEWKLQQPNGIIESFTITGTLGIGQVAPGGTAAGTVCFADTGQSGTFFLLWQPLFRVGRGVWLLPVPSR